MTIASLIVNVAANLVSFERDIKGIGSSLDAVGKTASSAGKYLSLALTAPIVGAGLAAAKLAMDFESSFAGVRKTVDATEPEFLQLAQGLRDMAKEIPVSVDELNRVAEAAGQLGIKKDDILTFTRTMADLGVTTNLTAEAAATATAQIQNIFGAAGKDVDRFGSTLVALGNAGASTEQDIIAMGLRIAGAGHIVGLTQAEVLSFASALSSVGINAEAGGSAISRVFLKINDAVASGGDKLTEFARVSGMSSEQFKKSFQTDAAGATVAFIEGLGRLKKEGENVNATLEGVVGKNIILKDTLLRASGAGQLLRDQIALGNKAWQDNTALTEEANKRYETLASQMTILWNTIKDVGITLGNALMPLMKELVSVAAALVPWIDAMVKGFTALPTWVQAGVLVFVALVAAIGPVIFIFGQFLQALSFVTVAFAQKAAAVRILTGLYGTLTVAVRSTVVAFWPLAAAITAVWAAWKIGNTETVKNSIASWALSADNLTAKLYRLVAGIEQMTPAEARAAVAATAAAVKHRENASAVVQVAAAVTTVTPALVQLDTVGKKVTETVEKKTQAMKSAAAASDRFRESIQYFNTADFTGGLVSMVEPLRVSADEFEVLASNVDLATSMFAPFAAGATEVRTHVGSLGQSLKNGLVDVMRDIPNTIKNALEGGGDWMGAIKSVAAGVGAAIGGSIGFAIGGPMGAAIGASIGSMASLLVNPLKKLFGIGINDEVRKANTSIEEVRRTLLSTYGTLDQLEAKARLVGLSFKDNWAHQGKEGLSAFNDLASEFEERQARLQTALEKYGFTWEDLGETARATHLEEMASGLLQSFAALTMAGLDADLVIGRMGEDINAFFNSAIRTGTEVPISMQPMLAKMVSLGLLIDDNGVAITDLGATGITFAESFTAGVDRIVGKLDEWLNKVFGISSGLSNIPENVQSTVVIDTIHNDFYNSYTGDTGEVPGFAGGSNGIRDFGRGTHVMLHGREEVRTEAQARSDGGSELAGIMSRIERHLRDSPRASALAFADALALQGVG